jgi:hypothetical protein
MVCWNIFGELLISGHRVSVLGDNRSYRDESHDGFTTLSMKLIHLNCTLKMVKLGKFCYVFFTDF